MRMPWASQPHIRPAEHFRVWALGCGPEKMPGTLSFQRRKNEDLDTFHFQRFYLFIFREKGRERERQRHGRVRETHGNGDLSGWGRRPAR